MKRPSRLSRWVALRKMALQRVLTPRRQGQGGRRHAQQRREIQLEIAVYSQGPINHCARRPLEPALEEAALRDEQDQPNRENRAHRGKDNIAHDMPTPSFSRSVQMCRSVAVRDRDHYGEKIGGDLVAFNRTANEGLAASELRQLQITRLILWLGP